MRNVILMPDVQLFFLQVVYSTFYDRVDDDNNPTIFFFLKYFVL